MITILVVLVFVVVCLLSWLVRTESKVRTNNQTIRYTANGPVYNGQLWKR